MLVRERGDQHLFVGRVGQEERVHEHGLGELAVGLPGAREGVGVAAVQLAADVAVDGHAGGGGRGVGARGLRAGEDGASVGGGHGAGGGLGGVAVREVGDEG